jgi:hypothetical protein
MRGGGVSDVDVGFGVGAAGVVIGMVQFSFRVVSSGTLRQDRPCRRLQMVGLATPNRAAISAVLTPEVANFRIART